MKLEQLKKELAGIAGVNPQTLTPIISVETAQKYLDRATLASLQKAREKMHGLFVEGGWEHEAIDREFDLLTPKD